ncbi:MAG: BrnT family toxin [Candidatus Accumulibacter sp.]|nr:BrnT family toxin [Accumulibacter sp.]
MEIEFDPVKDETNRKKHGMSLALAESFEWNNALVWPDERFNYDEARMSAMGYVGMSLCAMAFVERHGKTRVIRLRRATPKERKTYANAQTWNHPPHAGRRCQDHRRRDGRSGRAAMDGRTA